MEENGKSEMDGQSMLQEITGVSKRKKNIACENREKGVQLQGTFKKRKTNINYSI